jgi:hypothetical protein
MKMAPLPTFMSGCKRKNNEKEKKPNERRGARVQKSIASHAV